MRWFRRIWYWIRFPARQDELRDELQLHREMLAHEYERQGQTPADALHAARRRMGNESYMREEARGVWLAPWLDGVLLDWRYAWRGLRRTPGFTIVAALSLAIGIGANTAIFGVIDSLLLARLPVPQAARLVQFQRQLGAKGIDERLSPAEVEALAGGPLPVASFASTFASLELNGVASNVSVDGVDDGYFPLLGLRASRGRLVRRGDESAPVAVITDRFWRDRLNADAGALGSTIKIDRQSFTIIGITPAGFYGLRLPAIADVMIPYNEAVALHIVRVRDAHSPAVTVVALRSDGQSVEQVQRTLGELWKRCCAAGALVTLPNSATKSASTLRVVDVSRGIPLAKLDLRGQYTRTLLALMAGVGILLLAACANVANLLLARGSARAGELATRIALGASRSRLAGYLVAESMQLALLGGAAGLLLAWWGTVALSRDHVGDLTRVISTTPTIRLVMFTSLASIVSVMLFGIVPATRLLRSDIAARMRQSSGKASARVRGIFDRALVAAQVALALLLVSGAALFVQTLRSLEQLNLGFDAAHRMAVTVETRHTAYDRDGMTVQMADEMLRRIRAIPGVESASFGSLVPVYGGRTTFDNVTVRGAASGSETVAATGFVAVTPGYFASLGIPLLEGSDFAASDYGVSRATRDVIVNERFAKQFLSSRDPIGQEFQDADEGDSSSTIDRVVGVAGDTKFADMRGAAEPMYFVPVTDHDWPFLVLVVRSRADVPTLGAQIRRSVAAVSPGIGQSDPHPLSNSVDEALARERMAARLATLFGIVALLLVAVGLYGVMLYRVAERAREIGIRMALGADAASVVGLVLRQSLIIVVVGLAAGLPLALGAGRTVSSQLYGVSPYDPAALALAAAALVLTAALACIVPARRAVTVDVLAAIRSD